MVFLSFAYGEDVDGARVGGVLLADSLTLLFEDVVPCAEIGLRPVLHEEILQMLLYREGSGIFDRFGCRHRVV